ncbi:hypothetical protein FWH09_00580 [Candidatus Saccharibacteria bacterium]|nr:hypothetical protein [Candidatus Saccharibacteria bacterium]
MCVYIEIEDLAANALIEILKKNGERFVTYKTLEEYGAKVIERLTEKNERAVLILSRESTDRMLRNYSDFFMEEGQGDGMGIRLREGITTDKLIKRFRGYLAWDALLAFVDKNSVAKLMTPSYA